MNRQDLSTVLGEVDDRLSENDRNRLACLAGQTPSSDEGANLLKGNGCPGSIESLISICSEHTGATQSTVPLLPVLTAAKCVKKTCE